MPSVLCGFPYPSEAMQGVNTPCVAGVGRGRQLTPSWGVTWWPGSSRPVWPRTGGRPSCTGPVCIRVVSCSTSARSTTSRTATSTTGSQIQPVRRSSRRWWRLAVFLMAALRDREKKGCLRVKRGVRTRYARATCYSTWHWAKTCGFEAKLEIVGFNRNRTEAYWKKVPHSPPLKPVVDGQL